MHQNDMALFAAGKGRPIAAPLSHRAIGSPRRQRAGGNVRPLDLQPALPREERGFFRALPAHAGSAVFSNG